MENAELRLKVNDLDRKSRKYNLIFCKFQEKENRLEDIRSLLDVINHTIKLDCRFSDIRDIYRIGKLSTNTEIRPLVVEFVNFQLRQDILQNAKNLAGTGIGVSADLIPEDYQKQKFLRGQRKIALENGDQAKVKRNALIINGVEFPYDDLQKKGLQKKHNPELNQKVPPALEEGEIFEVIEPPNKKPKTGQDDRNAQQNSTVKDSSVSGRKLRDRKNTE